MDLRCRHHPDREAVGTCCYCLRSLCGECLSSNRQGKSYCRKEDDCLAYQDDQASTGEHSSPLVDYLTDGYSLEAQARRLSEILEELEELKGLLEDHEEDRQPQGSPTELNEPAHAVGIDPRIPGLCVHKLVEEAVALFGLISLRVDFIRNEEELSGSSVVPKRSNEVKGFLEEEAGPKIREYRNWAKPYGDSDVSQLLESLGKQDQQGKA